MDLDESIMRCSSPSSRVPPIKNFAIFDISFLWVDILAFRKGQKKKADTLFWDGLQSYLRWSVDSAFDLPGGKKGAAASPAPFL